MLLMSSARRGDVHSSVVKLTACGRDEGCVRRDYGQRVQEAHRALETPPVLDLEDSGRGQALIPSHAPPPFEQEEAGRGKHEKRQEIIQCIKLKSSYKEYSLILERGEELPCEVPGTPDPADENISKRKWESLVSKWRAALRQVEKIRNGVCDETDAQALDATPRF